MSPRHPNAPIFPIIPDPTSDSGSIFVGDTLSRVGRLEQQTTQVLPILGKVAEAVDNLGERFDDLSKDVKDVIAGFTAFRIETASFGSRLTDLEDRTCKYDNLNIEALERAKLKAEAVIEGNRLKAEAVLEVARKERIEKRNRIMAVAGTAIASVVSAALLTWLKLR